MTISMAVEDLFPWDFLMDACILACVQLGLDRLDLRRWIRSLLFLQAMTVLCLIFGLRNPVFQLLFCPLAALSLLGRRRCRIILEAAIAVFCAYGAAAGFVQLAGKHAAAVCACMPLFFLLLRRRHIRARWNIEILLEYRDMHVCFPALIDTGNRLREHGSGLPVLIVKEKALGAITKLVSPEDTVCLPYGVLGSSGELFCFRADRLSLRTGGRWIAAPECFVASFPAAMPGGITALAPPEFALSTEQNSIDLSNFKNTFRRFYHGVFKHPAIHLRSCRADSPRFGVLHRR